MEASFRIQRRVQFAETDTAGIVHFTSYLRYMEEAEHAFLRSRGLSAVLDDAKGKLGFPKLSARCAYEQPARFEDLIDVHVRICCEDGKSLVYDCEFFRGEERLGSGQLRVAFCRFPKDKPPYALPISETLLQQLF